MTPTDTRLPTPPSALDAVLTAQIIVAWAGEGSKESQRLGWWRSDLVDEDGGLDLFTRLLPRTGLWAALRGAREVARRTDAELRSRDHNPDRLLTLYHQGFELDEQLEERLDALSSLSPDPLTALPGLKDWIQFEDAEPFDRQGFEGWLKAQAKVGVSPAPTGRRLQGRPGGAPERVASQLLSALCPLPDAYPMPHFRRDV